MAKKKQKPPKFQQQIFCVLRNDNGEPTNRGGYLVADDDILGIEDGEEVAVYELKEVRVKHVAHSLTT